MFDEQEIITLMLSLSGLGVILGIFRGQEMARLRFFIVGYITLVSSHLFTVLEGLFLYDIFNYLEHIGYALASCFMVVACWRFRRRTP